MTPRWTTRIVNGACLMSAVLWVLSVVAAFLTLALNPWDHYVSTTPDFRIGVWSGFSRPHPVRGLCNPDPVLVFFNQIDGPYRGSLYTVEGDPNPPVVTRVDWEFPRIYYRRFRYDEVVEWTLMVSLWYPLILFAIGPLVWGVARWRRSRVKVELNPKRSMDNS